MEILMTPETENFKKKKVFREKKNFLAIFLSKEEK